MLGSGDVTLGAKGRSKDRLMCLTYALSNDLLDYEAVVDAAVQFRGMLKTEAVSFSMAEKLQIIKSLMRAKLRALKLGKQDGYHTFMMLDAISNDLVQIL
jgi:hypothetical protein